MKPRKVNKIVEEVTKNIIKRSKLNRLKYLQKLNAAKDLNIYGDSSVDVLTKIKILKDQLVGSRTDDLAQIQLIFPDYYTRMIEQGYGAYDGRRTTELVGSGAIKAEPQEFNYVITEKGLQ